ncbi:MAG: HlyD family efflux transporter periplasmic adaptor subunit [Duganella sp.]
MNLTLPAGGAAQANRGAGAQAGAKAVALPALRQELLLHAAPRSHDGAPAWTLEDPGRGLFFQIGWAEAEMLARWGLGQAALIAAAIESETALRLSADDVSTFARFLVTSNLTEGQGAEARQRYLREAQARRNGSWGAQAIKHYLFFRIPLLRPEPFLEATLPLLRKTLLTRRFAQLTIAAGAIGLLLAARQWDSFLHTFLHFFTLEGAAIAALTLGLTKLVHELGHAYAAKLHGCRVATMGVALMVMWPVLYTDASGAWRLRSRRQRMAIGGAGMAAELALSAWAILAWSFLPDGALRSAAFILATTTWLLTLAINLNPLMRFDGYFLLADALNVPNLQQRAFALGRWKLREWLFGLGDARPEIFAPWRERALIVYAFSVWIYRFFLFLGIALLVYHMAFKLLGIILFLIEIVTFILKPIYHELAAWRQRLHQGGGAGGLTPRARLSAVLLLAALLLAAIPWRTRVHAPGLLRAAAQQQLVAPSGARIASIAITPGQQVKAGQPLMTLDAPELRQELGALEQRIRVLEWQLSFQSMDQASMASAPVAQRELDAARQRHSLLARQHAQLTMTAPFDATVADLAAPLAHGEWVAGGEWLATLAAPGQGLVEAYVTEHELQRLKVGASAHFLAEDVALPARAMTVVDIAATASRRLHAGAELASPNGGAIAAVQEPAREGAGAYEARGWLPEQAVYRVLLKPRDGTDPALPRLQVLRGTVAIDGKAESFLMRSWRRALAIVIRETGF